jgi:hypothetical protein
MSMPLRLVVLSLLAFALSVGCAGQGDTTVSPAQDDPSGTTPDPSRQDGKAPSSTPPDGAPRSEAIDVAGVVATDLGEPVADRSVVIVDADAARQELRTDADGHFALGQVATPYDVAIAAGPGGSPTVLLGMTTAEPYIDVAEPEGPIPVAPPPQVVRVGVRHSPCGPRAETPNRDGDACSITVITGSDTGGGTTTTSCARDPAGASIVDVQHVWHERDVPSTELIAVHVLTTCRGATGSDDAYGYLRVPGIAAAPGETSDLGMVATVALPATAPIAFGVRASGDLAPWAWTTEVSLDVSSGMPRTEFLVFAAASPTATIRLPFLPSSNVRVRVSAVDARADLRDRYERSTRAWSGALPVVPLGKPPKTIAVDVAPGPELVRPTIQGALSRRDPGFSWTSAAPELATLVVIDDARGARFRVVTAEHEVLLARLEALGVPPLHEGSHTLDLSTIPRWGLSDAMSPDARVRRRPTDSARSGASTRLRAPFEVTK